MTRRSCVVTGSSGAIGSAIADGLEQAGWMVVGLDAVPPLETVVADSAVRVTVLGDVADPGAHARVADEANDRAPLRGWVNCAGYNVLGSVATLDPAALHRGVDVNLLGVFHGTAEAVRRFLATSADHPSFSIVNISSIHGSAGFPGFAAYAMCKGGIEALTRQVAAEYAGSGLRCNAVAPGLIHSPMNEALLANAEDPQVLRDAWDELSPIGRWGRPEDVSALVAFLMDEVMSGFMTGETIHVDGGARTLARGQKPWGKA